MTLSSNEMRNMDTLLGRETTNQNSSVSYIESDSDLLNHLKLVHGTLDLIVLVARDRKPGNQDELTLCEIGNRLFHDCSSAYSLTLKGYYHVSAMLLRDLLECTFLLHLFTLEPSKISDWRNARGKKDEDPFRASELRKKFNKTFVEDGTYPSRADAMYSFLCKFGTHPTYISSLVMLRYEGKPFWGPYFQKEMTQILLLLLAQCSTLAMCHLLGAFGSEKIGEKINTAWQKFYNELWKPWLAKHGGFLDQESLDTILDFAVETKVP